MKQIRIKICGLRRQEDIQLANDLKPDHIGFIFAPKSFRYVTADQAAALRAHLDPGISAVGVFVDEDPQVVAGLLAKGVIDAAQLHGHEDAAYITGLRQLTDRPLIQAFRIDSAADVCAANESAADMILLDHGEGGTGEAFDWTLLSGITRPYFLAGGLTPENVQQALTQCGALREGGEETEAGLYGVDVSSGVETDRVKDPVKATRFVQAVRNAGAIVNDTHHSNPLEG